MTDKGDESRKPLWLRADMITAISAVIVSVAALFVAADQARIARNQAAIMREEVHASVWPIVQVEYYWFMEDDGARAGFRLHNAGIGPAIIHGVIFEQDGTRYDSLNELIALAPQSVLEDPRPKLESASVRGRVIAPGADVAFIRTEWAFETPPDEERRREYERFFSALNPVDVSACFCSALSKCWISSKKGAAFAEEVDSCEGFEAGRF